MIEMGATTNDALVSSQSGFPRTRGQSFLEIEDSERGQVDTVGLTGNRQLIGRAGDLPIRLDHERISRVHAALVRDPYDRWWIHDLGSTNGTFVNGSSVTQRLLNPGDIVQVGPYHLTLKLPSDDPLPQERSRRTASPRVPLPGAAPVTSQTVSSVLTPLDAPLMLGALRFARSFLRIEDAQLRLQALCDYLVADRVPCLWAGAYRLDRDGSLSELYGPIHRPDRVDPLSPSVDWLSQFCSQDLLEGAGPRLLGKLPGRAGNVLVCVLGLFPLGGHLLVLELLPHAETEGFSALLALLVDSYGQATEFWQNRGQFTINAAIQRELEMAQQLQNSLIPGMPAVSGLELSIGYHPSRWVGGDYADAVRMPDGRLLITIADVCGKGLQAALVASSLHTLVHVLVEVCADLTQLVLHMDAYLRRFLPLDSFVTMICVALDAQTGELECINLGHPPALLIGADGVVRALQSGENLALGMARFVPCAERTRMDASELLLLYTDGLTELEDRRLPREANDPAEPGLLPGALSACVEIIQSMPHAEIDAIRDRISQSLKILLDLTMASDDAAFILARIRTSSRPTGRDTLLPESASNRRS